MKKLLILIFTLLVLVGCGTTSQVVAIPVTSEPSGANVDMNGVFRGKTPFTAQVSLVKSWIGLANSPDGYGYVNQDYQFVGYPPSGIPGGFQKKTLAAKDIAQGAAVHFQFGVVTNLPLIEQSIEVNKRPKNQ